MKDVFISDFTNPYFQKAFKLYFDDMGIKIDDWESLFSLMINEEDNYAYIRLGEQGEIIGFIQFSHINLSNWFFIAPLGFIREFWIDKAFRNLGYGTDLLVLAEIHFMNNGMDKSILTTETVPEFYEKRGYIKEVTIDAKNKDDVYIKTLN